MAAAPEIACVPVLSDNYVWLMHDPASGGTVAVDPGEAAPVLAAAGARGWRIDQVWVTHWHPDHTGGIAAVKVATGCTVSGPAAEAGKIPTLDVTLAEGDAVRLGAHEAAVWAVPGHTAGHIAFVMDGIAFTGDTLFAMGCGRLFEGTAAEMHGNMVRLAALPGGTAVYCGHEYTESNGRFALSLAPDDAAVAARLAAVRRLRADGLPTVPTTIALERETNPFMRAEDAETLGRLRAAKDAFR